MYVTVINVLNLNLKNNSLHKTFGKLIEIQLNVETNCDDLISALLDYCMNTLKQN